MQHRQRRIWWWKLRAPISYLEAQFRGIWPFVTVASPTPMERRIMRNGLAAVLPSTSAPVCCRHSGVDAV
jgi:hypothetical protein